jgi:hypothetical protein
MQQSLVSCYISYISFSMHDTALLLSSYASIFNNQQRGAKAFVKIMALCCSMVMGSMMLRWNMM